uniref:Uncharacterized protein n=1 Tax=Candidatus Kentrum sp. FW TaxID=2126338 RepID=A0A450TUV4_9GAMM|nr:MAG: hypothetical protein BECKFW1821C_GA0114237_103726 [Candidatus Kentron sp. FW]
MRWLRWRCPGSVSRYAYHQGLYVLAQSGEMVKVSKVRDDDAFEPKLW